MGTVIEPLPVTGFAENFSPIPRFAPPPFGSWIVGTSDVRAVCAPSRRRTPGPARSSSGGCATVDDRKRPRNSQAVSARCQIYAAYKPLSIALPKRRIVVVSRGQLSASNVCVVAPRDGAAFSAL